MKEKLLLSLLFLAYFSVSAQEFKKQSAITVAGGASFPVGTFASNDLYDEKAGLASVGGFASLGYDYQFSKSFGLIATVVRRVHSVNKEALGAYTLPSGSGATLTFSATPWKFIGLMGGVSQLVPITKNEELALEFKELVGVQFSNSPEITTSGFIPGVGSLNNVEKSQSVSSLAFCLGLGIKYKLGSNFKLKLFSEYQGASPKFKFIGSGPADQPVEMKMKQNTSAVNVGLGFVFGF